MNNKLLGLMIGCMGACGSSETNSSIDAARAIDAQTIDATPPTELEGTWNSACEENDGPPGTMSSHRTVTFQGNHFTSLQTYYLAAGCATPGLEFRETGTFAIGNMATLPAGATDIDYTQATAIAQTHAGYAATFNAAEICNVTLVDDMDVSMAGIACIGTTIAANGDTILGLFAISTTATPNTLTLGQLMHISFLGGPERPTEMDSREFAKQ